MAYSEKTLFELYLVGGAEASRSHLCFVKAQKLMWNLTDIKKYIVQLDNEGKKRSIRKGKREEIRSSEWSQRLLAIYRKMVH